MEDVRWSERPGGIMNKHNVDVAGQRVDADHAVDAVPVHLLTREALRLYTSKLKPRGIVAMKGRAAGA